MPQVQTDSQPDSCPGLDHAPCLIHPQPQRMITAQAVADEVGTKAADDRHRSNRIEIDRFAWTRMNDRYRSAAITAIATLFVIVLYFALA